MLTEGQFSKALKLIKEDQFSKDLNWRDLPTLVNIELIEYEPVEDSEYEPGSPEMSDSPGDPGMDELSVKITATIEGDLATLDHQQLLPLTGENFELYKANFGPNIDTDELHENLISEIAVDYPGYDFSIGSEPKVNVYERNGKVRVHIIAFGSREKTDDDYDQGWSP